MKESWLADLHIHTPASSDYRGPKEDAEYMQIIKLSKENQMDIIAITDHFSIKGYERIKEIQHEKQMLMKLLKKQNKYEESPLIEELREEIDLFDSILILMGIEVNISPGIHYIIIFSEKITTGQVEIFLGELDVDLDKYDGAAKYMIETNSIEFFKQIKERFGEECIIYAPHANQNSGVVKTLDGIARQNVLKDKNLACIGFNQESDREYIKENILSHIKRESELTFIQDSDYHAKVGQRVGEMYFYIENEEKKEVSYNLIYETLINKSSLKTSCDTEKERYEELISNKKVFQFENTKLQCIDIKEGWEEFAKTFCAIVNSNNEKYLVEIEGQVGEDLDKEEVIANYTNLLVNKLVEDDFKVYEIAINKNIKSKSKIRILISIRTTTRLSMYAGRCYIISKEGNVEVAKANDIEAIVAEKMYIRFGRKKDFKMKKIAEQCIGYSKELLAYSVVYKIIDNIKFIDKITLKKFQSQDSIQNNPKQIIGNGEVKGDVIIFQSKELRDITGGRLKDSYLRISAPRYKIVSNSSDIAEANSILIVPRGGVFLVEEKASIETDMAIVSLQVMDDSININYLVAYLKSSLFQWIISKNYMKDDIYSFIISLKNPIIPILDILIKNTHEKLGEYIEELINKENDFIIEERDVLKYNKNLNQPDIKNLLIKKVNIHNKEAEEIMKNIDSYFFDQLQLSVEDREQIIEDLKRLNIYCW